MGSTETMFCVHCGKEIAADAVVCIHCGRPVTPKTGGGSNKWLASLLLCFFLGFLGAHRFYTGHMVSGFLQLITFGGFGFWWLFDFIMILSGNFKDKNGMPLKS
jgi:hypothetical protein